MNNIEPNNMQDTGEETFCNAPKESYTVITTNDRLWEIPKLVGHLVKQQGKDLVLNLVPEAQCIRSTGLYDLLDQFQFNSVTIYTWNELESHTTYNIIHKLPRLFFASKIWSGWNIQPSDSTWNQQYMFGAFYGRPTADRLGIAGHLFAHHRNLTRFALPFNIIDDDSRSVFELEKLFVYNSFDMAKFSKLIEHLPLDPDVYVPPNWAQPGPMFKRYKDILIDIVSEPNIAGTSFFFTEKTTRPMILKKGFIHMSAQNSLCYLRQMGFKTFYEFWNEDYDGYSGKDRYLKILDLLDNLASMSKQQQIDMYHAMQSVLEHNYALLENQTYSTNVELVI